MRTQEARKGPLHPVTSEQMSTPEQGGGWIPLEGDN
jgi:hypothetical protein